MCIISFVSVSESNCVLEPCRRTTCSHHSCSVRCKSCSNWVRIDGPLSNCIPKLEWWASDSDSEACGRFVPLWGKSIYPIFLDLFLAYFFLLLNTSHWRNLMHGVGRKVVISTIRIMSRRLLACLFLASIAHINVQTTHLTMELWWEKHMLKMIQLVSSFNWNWGTCSLCLVIRHVPQS